MLAWGLGLVGWLAGCSSPQFHRCQDDAQCLDGRRHGVCAAGGHCAFDDQTCASGLVYGELVEPGLAGECVPADEGTQTGASGSGSGSGHGSAAETSGSSASPPGDDTATTPDCPAGVGGPCQPEDPCAVVGTCNDEGTCIPTGFVECDTPPGPCHEPSGECLPGIGCQYALLPASTSCEDGDPCTVGDACDDAGACVPGPMCPNDDPCQAAECSPEGCAFTPLPDGSACGMTSALRCCGGSCVDVSSDAGHCGGCGSACAAGQMCESVGATAQCDDSPADTSARCRCSESAHCPLGQICRTVIPYAGRCAPEGNANCDGVMVPVDLCPNYCGY